MTTIVFAGPTLRAADIAARLPDATLHAPAQRGDVLAAVHRGFRRIAIIDGYFDQKQPVWHKEILWALRRGCLVYGAASMGALRAAELHSFGMVGVGLIFEWYRDGILEADDEVAVCHESEASGFHANSVALVNMRVTLRKAAAREVVHIDQARALIAVAEGLFYAERSYEALLRAAGGRGSELERWLADPDNRVDQKALDALALLEELALPKLTPPCTEFEMAKTEAWYELTREYAATTSTPLLRAQAE